MINAGPGPRAEADLALLRRQWFALVKVRRYLVDRLEHCDKSLRENERRRQQLGDQVEPQ